MEPIITAPNLPLSKKFSFSKWLTNRFEFVPSIVTLLLLALFFTATTEGIFLSPSNLTSLAQQIGSVGLLAIAAGLCLLVGELNLSLSATAGVAGAVMATLSVYQGWDATLCILAALGVGMLVGLVQGIFVAFFRVPSFVVTLAGTIGCTGLLLIVMGKQNTLVIRDPALRELAPAYQSIWVGAGFPVTCLLVAVGIAIYSRWRKRKLGLRPRHSLQILIELGSLSTVVFGGLLMFYTNLGMPNSTLIWLTLVLVFWLLLKFTDFGLHVYAVGDNSEAARRAGVNTVAVKTWVFVLAGILAAGGGVLHVSRATAAVIQFNLTLFLYPIAIAVVAGISLFGGRGSIWTVTLGAIIIGGLDNGLDLLNQDGGIKLLAQGVVLLIAVTADVVIQNNRKPRQLVQAEIRQDRQLDTILQDLNRAARFIKRKEQTDQEVSQQVLELSVSLKQAASQQATGSKQQKNAVLLVSESVEQLSTTADNISKISEEVNGAITKIATDSQQINQTTNFSVEQSRLGAVASNRTVDASQEVAQVYQQLVATLNDLSAKNASTRRIMELLGTLASELHLLALNAAIEAAGSGIHGERFAVVAQEVKNLAARSREASQEVVGIVQQIETASQQAAVSAQAGYQKALDMETIALEARTIFEGMRQVAEQSQLQAVSINQAAQQVGSMTEVIKVASVQQQEANQEVREALQALEIIAQDNVQGSQLVESTARNLETVSQNLVEKN